MGRGANQGRSLVAALGCALATSCFAVSAVAAKPGQAFRLEYWAEGHCPDAVEFARQIQTRAPRLRPAEADEPALGFYAELAEHAGSATGRLTARSPDGREVVREVRGPTCEDVSTALALIAALAADPSQSAEPVAPPAQVPVKRSAPAPRHDRAERHEPAPESRAQSELLDPLYRWTYGVGGGLAFDSSIAPSPGYGLGISFEAEAPGGSPARWLLSLSAIRAAAANTETAGGSASFTWVGLRLAACPLRWPEETPLFFRPCAFFDAGVLSGDVAYGPLTRDRSATYTATGGFGRIEELVGEVVSFQLDVGVTVPLAHPTFSVPGADAPAAFRVPAAGILGRIGLSYRFQ